MIIRFLTTTDKDYYIGLLYGIDSIHLLLRYHPNLVGGLFGFDIPLPQFPKHTNNK